MATDAISDNIALLCLATGCTALSDGPGGIVLAGPDFSIPIFNTDWETRHTRDFRTCSAAEYLMQSDFAAAVKAISESAAQASLDAYDDYVKLLQHVQSAGTLCKILLRPVANVWPDAAAQLIPWSNPDTKPTAYERIYPAIPRLDAVAFEFASPADDYTTEAWCTENPTELILSADGKAYCGWNQATGRVARLPIETVDLKTPWRIIAQPDGSETVTAATPLIPAAPLLNYYEAAT